MVNNKCGDISCSQCGGCNISQGNYDSILKEKVNNAIVLLKEVYKKDVEVISMEDAYNYRNKGKYVFGNDYKTNSIKMGFFEEGTHRIVNTTNCKIKNEIINEVADYFFELVKKYKISIYDEDKKKGILRHLVVRVGVNSNEIMVILVTADYKLSRGKDIVNDLITKFPNIKSIVQNINEKENSAVLGEKNYDLYGNGFIVEKLEQYKFKISPLSFFQVNTKQTVKLYNKAIEYANLNENDIVYDLYCGTGTISVFLAKHVKYVYGIEVIPDAIKDAKINLQFNKINNINLQVGKVEFLLPKLYTKGIKPNVIFVDPPRSGLDNKTIQALLNIKSEKIIYISCNPVTFVDNVKSLNEQYVLEKVSLVDMFPFTSHIECVSILKLKSEYKY